MKKSPDVYGQKKDGSEGRKKGGKEAVLEGNLYNSTFKDPKKPKIPATK